MTQLEANERDARRYRILRALTCASPERQREAHALIAHLLGSTPSTQAIDRAMDHLLNTLKIV